mgnify:CR=1 FL=1
MPLLFILFILVPLVEIWGILQVGSLVGAGSTLLLIVLSALAGSILLRQQGLHTLLRARQRLDRGELPLQELLEGLLLAIAGALLLTPGFFTDGVGIALLVPPLRLLLIRHLASRVEVRSAYASSRTTTIEGEYRREE